MRILEVSRYKDNFADHQLPFVTEQGESLRALGHEVEYFLVKGNYIKAVGALKTKIRESKPDIVHAHFGLSAITAELQSMVPVVTTFHNGETLNPLASDSPIRRADGSIQPSGVEELYKRVEQLVAMPSEERRATFQSRREKMLSDKIDCAKFLTYFIENYPQSAEQTRKADISFWDRFK